MEGRRERGKEGGEREIGKERRKVGGREEREGGRMEREREIREEGRKWKGRREGKTPAPEIRSLHTIRSNFSMSLRTKCLSY